MSGRKEQHTCYICVGKSQQMQWQESGISTEASKNRYVCRVGGTF